MMAFSRSGTLVKAPRRMFLAVISAKKRSTTLSQDAQQPLNAFVAIASPPALHRQKAFAHCGCNRPGTHSLASQKNDPRSPDHLLRRVAIPDETFQPLPICFSNCNSFDLAHNAGIPRFIRFGNRPSVTDHCGQVISHGEQI